MLKGNCTFLGSAKYPDVYLAGLGIQKIGNTSLTYKLALFNPIKECINCYLQVKEIITINVMISALTPSRTTSSLIANLCLVVHYVQWMVQVKKFIYPTFITNVFISLLNLMPMNFIYNVSCMTHIYSYSNLTIIFIHSLRKIIC